MDRSNEFMSMLSISREKAFKNAEEAKNYIILDLKNIASILSSYHPLEIAKMSVWEARRVEMKSKDPLTKATYRLFPIIIQSALLSTLFHPSSNSRDVRKKDWLRIISLAEDVSRRLVRYIDSIALLRMNDGLIDRADVLDYRAALYEQFYPSEKNHDKLRAERVIAEASFLSDSHLVEKTFGVSPEKLVKDLFDITDNAMDSIEDLKRDILKFKAEIELRIAKAKQDNPGISDEMANHMVYQDKKIRSESNRLAGLRDDFDLFRPEFFSSITNETMDALSGELGKVDMISLLFDQGLWASTCFPFIKINGMYFTFVARYLLAIYQRFSLTTMNLGYRVSACAESALSQLFVPTDVVGVYSFNGKKVDAEILSSLWEINVVSDPELWQQRMKRRSVEMESKPQSGHTMLIVNPDSDEEAEYLRENTYTCSALYLLRVRDENELRHPFYQMILGEGYDEKVEGTMDDEIFEEDGIAEGEEALDDIEEDSVLESLEDDVYAQEDEEADEDERDDEEKYLEQLDVERARISMEERLRNERIYEYNHEAILEELEKDVDNDQYRIVDEDEFESGDEEKDDEEYEDPDQLNFLALLDEDDVEEEEIYDETLDEIEREREEEEEKREEDDPPLEDEINRVEEEREIESLVAKTEENKELRKNYDTISDYIPKEEADETLEEDENLFDDILDGEIEEEDEDYLEEDVIGDIIKASEEKDNKDLFDNDEDEYIGEEEEIDLSDDDDDEEEYTEEAEVHEETLEYPEKDEISDEETEPQEETLLDTLDESLEATEEEELDEVEEDTEDLEKLDEEPEVVDAEEEETSDNVESEITEDAVEESDEIEETLENSEGFDVSEEENVIEPKTEEETEDIVEITDEPEESELETTEEEELDEVEEDTEDLEKLDEEPEVVDAEEEETPDNVESEITEDAVEESEIEETVEDSEEFDISEEESDLASESEEETGDIVEISDEPEESELETTEEEELDEVEEDTEDLEKLDEEPEAVDVEEEAEESEGFDVIEESDIESETEELEDIVEIADEPEKTEIETTEEEELDEVEEDTEDLEKLDEEPEVVDVEEEETSDDVEPSISEDETEESDEIEETLEDSEDLDVIEESDIESETEEELDDIIEAQDELEEIEAENPDDELEDDLSDDDFDITEEEDDDLEDLILDENDDEIEDEAEESDDIEEVEENIEIAEEEALDEDSDLSDEIEDVKDSEELDNADETDNETLLEEAEASDDVEESDLFDNDKELDLFDDNATEESSASELFTYEKSKEDEELDEDERSDEEELDDSHIFSFPEHVEDDSDDEKIDEYEHLIGQEEEKREEDDEIDIEDLQKNKVEIKNTEERPKFKDSDHSDSIILEYDDGEDDEYYEEEEDEEDEPYVSFIDTSIYSPIIQEILNKTEGDLSPLYAFLQNEDENVISYFDSIIQQSWERQTEDGKDKMFSVFEYDMSLLLSKGRIYDDLRLQELMNNAGAVMYAENKKEWNALLLYINTSYTVESAKMIKITRESFTPYNWKIVTNIGNALIARKNK